MKPIEPHSKDLPPDVQALLDAAPAITEEERRELEEANRALEDNPAFQADLHKSQFVEQVLEAMDEQGLNRNTLAKKWGKSRQYLGKILDEDRRVNFTIETMTELLHLLDKRLDLRIAPALKNRAFADPATWTLLEGGKSAPASTAWRARGGAHETTRELVVCPGPVAESDGEYEPTGT